jgi:hypothetical protein
VRKKLAHKPLVPVVRRIHEGSSTQEITTIRIVILRIKPDVIR